MSIFGIIGIAVLIAVLVFAVGMLIMIGANDCETSRVGFIITAIVSACALIAGIFIGIGISDESDRIYVQQYLAAKHTIEVSLTTEDLTGFERMELVNQASAYNSELAGRKAKFDRWHCVHYDNTIYDGVEFISLEVKK